jgi:hypothetical protein
MPKERGETGQFVETVTSEDVLDVFDGVDGPPVVTSADVADATGLSRDSARRKLSGLFDEGRVGRRESAGRVLYWLTDWRASTAPAPETPDPTPEEPDRHEEGETGTESASSETGVPTTPDTDDGDTDSATARDDELVADVRAYLADRPPRTSYGQEAVLDVFRLLRERGTMKTGELKDALYTEYGEHYDSKKAMWNTLTRYFDDVPGLMKPGHGEWGYAGDDVVREAVDETNTGGVYDPTEEFES